MLDEGREDGDSEEQDDWLVKLSEKGTNIRNTMTTRKKNNNN